MPQTVVRSVAQDHQAFDDAVRRVEALDLLDTRPGELRAAWEDVLSALEPLVSHLDHEDSVLVPRLQAVDPGMAHRIEAEHTSLRRAFLEMSHREPSMPMLRGMAQMLAWHVEWEAEDVRRSLREHPHRPAVVGRADRSSFRDLHANYR